MEILYCSRCNKVVPPGGPDEGKYFMAGEEIVCPKCYYSMDAEDHTGATVLKAPRVERRGVGSRIGPAVRSQPAKPPTSKVMAAVGASAKPPTGRARAAGPGTPASSSSARLRAIRDSRAVTRLVLAVALMVAAVVCVVVVYFVVRARQQAPPDAGSAPGTSPGPRPGPEPPRPAPSPAPSPEPRPPLTRPPPETPKRATEALPGKGGGRRDA
jgi:hypothetical protein